MIVYIVIGVLFVYAVYKERQALGCKTVPDGTDCDNANGKAVKGTFPFLHDTKEVLKEKIELAVRAHERFVVWRLSFIIALISTLAIWAMAFSRFPHESELLLSLFAIATLIYFSYGFYHFHLWSYVERNAALSLKYLTQNEQTLF